MFPVALLLAVSAPVPVPRPVPPPQITPGFYVWYVGEAKFNVTLGGTPGSHHGVYACEGGWHGRWQWCPRHRVVRIEESFCGNGVWTVYQFTLDRDLDGPNSHHRLRKVVSHTAPSRNPY